MQLPRYLKDGSRGVANEASAGGAAPQKKRKINKKAEKGILKNYSFYTVVHLINPKKEQ
jgi:hypothetical protein